MQEWKDRIEDILLDEDVAAVEYDTDDIMQVARICEIEITEDEALEFLRSHKNELETRMDNAGLLYVSEYLEKDHIKFDEEK